MKKKIIASLCCVMLIGSCCVDLTYAKGVSKKNQYTITSGVELKEKIAKINKDGKITKQEKTELEKSTKPEVMVKFIDEKMELGKKAMQEASKEYEITEGENSEYKYEKNLGDGCKIVIEIEDKEETSFISSLTSLFIETASAAENGEVLWKPYGNRYYTAKSNIFFTIGYAQLILENHYYVSSDGLKIRYGYSDCNAIGLGGTVDEGEPVITDRYAKTIGKSDVNMYCKYKVHIDQQGIQSSYNHKLETRAIYQSLDKKNKRAKVKHVWSVD